MKTVADVLGVARSNLSVQAAPPSVRQRRGRHPQPDAALLVEIKTLIVDLPTYGYRRVHALLRRRREQTGEPAVNVKRVYRVMKAHGLLLQRHSGRGIERRHDGRVAVDQSDIRWCSDGFEIGCDNGERVRIAFTLDCCDREAISWVATTGGIDGSDIRDLTVESVERRFGLVDELPKSIKSPVANQTANDCPVLLFNPRLIILPVSSCPGHLQAVHPAPLNDVLVHENTVVVEVHTTQGKGKQIPRPPKRLNHQPAFAQH